MNTQTVMLMMLVLIVVVGMWQSRRMKTMVFCTYSSRSKQTFDKLVREKDGCVYFEGKKFHLLPAYGESKYYDKGFSSFFPTKITAYKFRWGSPYPIDPNTGEPAMLSENVIAKLDQESAMLDYAGSQQRALSTVKSKLGGLDKWMPYIMIGLAIAIAYLIYTNYTMQQNNKVTQQAIIDIYNTFNQHNMPVIPVK